MDVGGRNGVTRKVMSAKWRLRVEIEAVRKQHPSFSLSLGESRMYGGIVGSMSSEGVNVKPCQANGGRTSWGG